MAPKTALPLDAEADVPGGAQSPGELLDLMRAGLTWNGVRVLTLRVGLEDGTTQRIQLPAPRRAGKDWTRTKAGRAVLDVLSREARPLKGDTIAKLADYPYTGSFRSALKGLVDQGEVHHSDDGYELVG